MKCLIAEDLVSRREQYLALIRSSWLNKDDILALLCRKAVRLSWNWDPISVELLLSLFAQFGKRIGLAKDAEGCCEAFLRLLTCLRCSGAKMVVQRKMSAQRSKQSEVNPFLR